MAWGARLPAMRQVITRRTNGQVRLVQCTEYCRKYLAVTTRRPLTLRLQMKVAYEPTISRAMQIHITVNNPVMLQEVYRHRFQVLLVLSSLLLQLCSLRTVSSHRDHSIHLVATSAAVNSGFAMAARYSTHFPNTAAGGPVKLPCPTFVRSLTTALRRMASSLTSTVLLASSNASGVSAPERLIRSPCATVEGKLRRPTLARTMFLTVPLYWSRAPLPFLSTSPLAASSGVRALSIFACATTGTPSSWFPSLVAVTVSVLAYPASPRDISIVVADTWSISLKTSFMSSSQ
ncbi:hypothetical protein BC835DRAFT_228891 [Cytidiella melzeri]|nr:hypothetical protein BC835DRAFT_228891 [Cytidiella melzeri]